MSRRKEKNRGSTPNFKNCIKEGDNEISIFEDRSRPPEPADNRWESSCLYFWERGAHFQYHHGTIKVSKSCTLWKANRSPACRAVMMALDAMNINVREVDVNLDKGEHRSPDITAMNPRQTLPILKDKDLVLCDSNAIVTYMASRYGGGAANTLLPSDPAGRALVEQYMHFNSSVLYPQYKAASNPVLYQNSRVIAMPTYCEIHCAYYDMENMLSDRAWFNLADKPSLADIVLAATVSTLHILAPIQKRKYPKLASWLSRISEKDFYITANKKGLAAFAKRIDVSENRQTKQRDYVKEELVQAPPLSVSQNPSFGDSIEVENFQRPVKYRDTTSGDNIEVQKPIKYKGETTCYLADLPRSE